MQKVIMFFVMAAMLLGIPELLNVLQPTVSTVATVAEPGTVGAMASQIQGSMSGVVSLLSVTSYIAGLMFSIRGVLALKEYSETGGVRYINEEEEDKKEEIEPPKIKIEKTVPLSINDKKIESLIEKIKSKSAVLLSNPQINNEIELKHIVDKSVSAYVPKVVEAYTQISPDLRKTSSKNGISAHDMTCQQLELIYDGLSEIELKLLSKNHDRLKVSGKFLNQIFKKKEQADELEM